MKGFAILFLFIFMFSLVSAAPISDKLNLNIQTTDLSGNKVTGTFNFAFNITDDANCNNVLYSNLTTLTTDSRGVISYYLENLNLPFDEAYYLCYYRDGDLKSSSELVRVPYSFNSQLLGGYNENFFLPLNTSIVGDFNIQGSLFINGIDALNGSSEDTIPLNTIIYYNGTTCPQGFSELTSAQGRYVVGLNTSNGTLEGTIGTALFGEENRSTGAHTHDPAVQTHYAYNLNGGTVDQPGSGNLATYGVATTTGNVTGGAITGTNAPYVQYLACIKTSTVQLTAGWNQNASNIWVADTNLKVGIGTTSPQNKLNVLGRANITDGLILNPQSSAPTSPSSGTFFYNSTSNLPMFYDGSNWTIIGKGVPNGGIMAFASSCPSGWTEYTSAQGRYIVGVPSGGTLEGTDGTALSDLEDRPVGNHTHGTGSTGSTNLGSHNHNIPQGISNSPTVGGGGSMRNTVQTSSGSTNNANLGSHSHTIDYTNTVNGTNAPYIQLMWCQKVGQDSSTSESFWGNTVNDLFVQNTTWSVIIGATSNVASEMLRVVGDVLFEGDLNVTGNISVSGGIDVGGNGIFLKTKVIEMGDWNMVANRDHVVTHGLSASEVANIRSVTGVIRDDADNLRLPIGSMNTAGVMQSGFRGSLGVDDTDIDLSRVNGGNYDGTNYDATGYNRGWITIVYEAP